MIEKDALDLTATITTPENIQFEYRIAGPFRRLPALVTDLLIRVMMMCGLVFVVTIVGIFTFFQISGAIAIAIVLIGFFLLDWSYGWFFETVWNGRTPGKKLTRIRVISIDGRPISAYQAVIRNLLRLGDMAPMLSFEIFNPDAPPVYRLPTFLVALICMLFTRRMQRLGDLAAGTMVVVDESTWQPQKVKFDDPRVAALSEFIPPSFRMSNSLAKTVALYVERRGRLAMGRRVELAANLAGPLLKLFDFRDDTSPDLLLCALYYRDFMTKDAVVP